MPSFRYKAACVFLLTIFLWLPHPTKASSEFNSSTPERPLKWKVSVVNISIPRTINSVSGIPAEAFREAATLAANSWGKVAAVDIRFRETDVISISPAGLKGDGINLVTNAATDENLKLFTTGPDSLPASTRVFFDKLGNITEADIALNPFLQFSIDGTFGTYDLQAVLTHEIGHMLGLDHSSILSSRMYESIPKNGLLNADRFALRQLTTIDIAAVRAKYSGRPETVNCCTSISGTVASTLGLVWLSDKDSGRVFAITEVSATGRFLFNGLAEDDYFVTAQGIADSPFAAVRLGEITTEIGNTHRVKGALSEGPYSLPSPRYIGVRGQLGTTAIRLKPGDSERIFLGMVSKDSLNDISVGIDSDHFQIIPDSSLATKYNRDITSLSADVKVSTDTPPGSYSIFIQNISGSRRYLVGAIEIVAPVAEQ
jgi:hypothetical protein